jgi:hypothetical protein
VGDENNQSFSPYIVLKLKKERKIVLVKVLPKHFQ